MKGKILKSEYNPGYDSWILKETKYGTFSGHARLHEEDSDIDNSFDGCRIAEFRADLKAYYAKARVMRERAIGARLVFENSKTLIKDANIEKSILDTVRMLEKQANDAYEYYNRMKAYEPIYIKNLTEARRVFQSKMKND